jgi:RND family efflux transporter MFP subunit
MKQFKKTNKHQTVLLIAVAILSATFLQSCKKEITANPISKNEIIPVKTIPLQQKGIAKTIEVSGQFSTDDEVTLSFKTGGIINQILIKEGDYVKKGQLLAKLDLTEIKTAVNQNHLALAKAKRDYERMNNLYKDSVVTLEQFQNVKTALEIAKQQNEAIQFNFNYSEIRAVQNGYILKKFVNVGQLVTAGQAIIQTNGAGQNKWVLKTSVSDTDWALITIGDKASVKIDALKNTLIDAKVIRKSQGIDEANGTFLVELEINPKYAKNVASGMFGAASVYSKKTNELWSIPYEALLDANGNEGYVFVTDDNQKAQKVKVIIHQIDKTQAQISEGLENHKRLIISGNAYLTDHSSISLTQ